jgi:DNA topoisomerase-6 subunit B
MASVWVPVTRESKEAVAGYPEILKELRLGLQAVGRKLAVYLNRRNKVRQEGQRREIFLRYLGEVASAIASINDLGERSRKDLYSRLVDVAKRKTAVADTQMDDRGQRLTSIEEDLGDNVIIVKQEE